jgi:hypothetical protein
VAQYTVYSSYQVSGAKPHNAQTPALISSSVRPFNTTGVFSDCDLPSRVVRLPSFKVFEVLFAEGRGGRGEPNMAVPSVSPVIPNKCRLFEMGSRVAPQYGAMVMGSLSSQAWKLPSFFVRYGVWWECLEGR